MNMGSGWMRDLTSQPKTRGFLWGVGAAVTAYFVWPAFREAVRPSRQTSAMMAGEQFRDAYGSARGSVDDLMAEAQVGPGH